MKDELNKFVSVKNGDCTSIFYKGREVKCSHGLDNAEAICAIMNSILKANLSRYQKNILSDLIDEGT